MVICFFDVFIVCPFFCGIFVSLWDFWSLWKVFIICHVFSHLVSCGILFFFFLFPAKQVVRETRSSFRQTYFLCAVNEQVHGIFAFDQVVQKEEFYMLPQAVHLYSIRSPSRSSSKINSNLP